MFFKLDSFALIGIEAIKVTVEIHISNGMPSFTIVGLPDKSINEARDRVKASIINSGFIFPLKKIIINLSPADLRKEGSIYDLPIALAILKISGQAESDFFDFSSFIGELSLNGAIDPVKGILSMAQKSAEMQKKYFFIPQGNKEEAVLIKNISIVGCEDLNTCIKILNGKQDISKHLFVNTEHKKNSCVHQYKVDFSEVRGQLRARRALEIAASGMHNIMLVGLPGSGKSMLAERATTIMPDLSFDEKIEVTKIYSTIKRKKYELVSVRPFRNPHHTISETGLIGGGVFPRPGEISLAHRGVLFLDEFSEFPVKLSESLRQPLENKSIVISRNNVSCRFPCSFMLILAMNPCFCGYFGDEYRKCKCSIREVEKYWKKISGPIIDRVDMHAKLPRLREDLFFRDKEIENSNTIRLRVEKAILVQKERYKDKEIKYNSEAGPEFLNSWISDDRILKKTIIDFSKKAHLTSRGMASLIKVSRTIADLEEEDDISESHISEAFQYKISNIV
ncbi:MAG: YifB family Mg chelatase-like AAA ATPase [Candidatus Humimicrobiaceae bacterium]